MAHPEHNQKSLNLMRAITNLGLVGRKFNWEGKEVEMRTKMLIECIKDL